MSANVAELVANLFQGGLGNLAAYLAAHVLLCLVPAFTFLFFAPAGNILALAYTGVTIGADLAVARLIMSLAFGIGIGMIMALIFRRSDQQRAEQAAHTPARP